MGIKVEFNPDLALRSIKEFKAGRRALEECIPELLQAGKKYPFLKSGQRLYNIGSKTPLLQTEGAEVLSEPVAAIRILEVTHVVQDEEVITRGTYIVDTVFDNGWVGFGGYGK